MQATVENVMLQLASLESEVQNQADSTAKDNNDILQQALQNSGLPSERRENIYQKFISIFFKQFF